MYAYSIYTYVDTYVPTYVRINVHIYVRMYVRVYVRRVRTYLRMYVVMGGYSHLFPSGHFPRFIFSWFCVPVCNAVFVARHASPRRSPPGSLRFYLSRTQCSGHRNVT